jgi:hypothetical protein
VAFRKVLKLYRRWKEKKEIDAMFRIVNEFDQIEGYDKWLANQVQMKALNVVEEESCSDDHIESPKQSFVKPLQLVDL